MRKVVLPTDIAYEYKKPKQLSPTELKQLEKIVTTGVIFDRLTQFFDEDTTRVTIAKYNNRIVGWSITYIMNYGVSTTSHKAVDKRWLMICVRPTYRKLGIGTQLFKLMKDKIRIRKYVVIPVDECGREFFKSVGIKD
jgi:GNAT superfamily N-acetyltransferase